MKEQYDSTISNGGSAYIAAFVGCTYYCMKIQLIYIYIYIIQCQKPST